MRRPLRGLEKTMVQVGDTMGPDVVVGEVRGSLPAGVLRRAAEMLQRQYATLRTRVVGNEILVGGPRPMSFEVVSGDWQLFAELELARPLRLRSGETMRVVYVPQDGVIILSVHHALVDGTSLLVLLRDLLGHCAAVLSGDLEEPPCVPLAEAVMDSVAGAFWHAPVGGVLAAAAPLVVQAEQHVFLGQGMKEGTLRSNVVFGEGTVGGMKRLRAACAIHGVTIGAAAMAAGAFAMGRVRGERVGWWKPTDVEVEVDLRRWANPPLPTDRVGFHTGGVRVDAEDVDFWTLARTLKDRVSRQIDHGVPRLSHVIAEHLDWEPRSMPGSWVAVSNLGRFPHPTTYGSLELEAVYGMNGCVPGGPAAIFWLRTLNGRVCFNAVGSAPTLSTEELKAASAEFLEILENPSAGRLRPQRPGLSLTAPLRATP